MSPAEARELLAMVEAFLLRPPRRGKRARVRVRTRRPPHSLEHDYDLRGFERSDETPEELRAWRAALNGPTGGPKPEGTL